MKHQKPIKKIKRDRDIDRVFLKKIENLKEEEKSLMLKLYNKVIKEIIK